jgi:hypothetical protein
VSDQEDVRVAKDAALRSVRSALEIRQLIAEYFGSAEQVEEHASRLELLIDKAIRARIRLRGKLSVSLENAFAAVRSSSVEGWGGTLYRSAHEAALVMVEEALSLPVEGSGIEPPLRTWDFSGEKQAEISRAFRKHHQAIQRRVQQMQNPEAIAPAIRRGICEESEKVLAAFHPPPGAATAEPVPAHPPQGTTSEGEHLFRREGNFWRIRYGAEAGLAKHIKGMAYIATLLGSPHKLIDALDLDAPTPTLDKATYRMTQDETVAASDEGEIHLGGPRGQAVLDNPAFNQYRRRLQQIEEELAQARKNKDQGRVDRLVEEEFVITKELGGANASGGRKRLLGPPGPAEKARQAVRKAIDRAIDSLEKMQPPLAQLVEHLKASLPGENMSFVYRPVGPAPAWDL